ncbi:MAG: hypothetical protein ACI9O6_002426 [Glaciecola sp.]|jgi:hypothetical protein
MCLVVLGYTKLDSTIRYVGIEVDDALEISESIDIRLKTNSLDRLLLGSKGTMAESPSCRKSLSGDKKYDTFVVIQDLLL